MANKPGQEVTTHSQFVPPEEMIGERIQRRRTELGLNFEELARLTASYDPPDYEKGLTPTMLARYEKGIEGRPVLPGARELRILCSALNVSPEWLLLGVDRVDAGTQAVEIAQTLGALLALIQSYGTFGEGRSKSDQDAEHNYKVAQAKLQPAKKSTS